MASPQVRVGVGVFVLASSQISLNPRFLVGKRKNSHGAGTIALPGGHLNYGETLEDCAAREVLEETGLSVINVQFLTATNDIMMEDKKHYVTIFMVCGCESANREPIIMEPEKCEWWQWADWEDLVKWIEQEDKTPDCVVPEKKIFLPLLNLVKQRPGVVPKLT